MLALLKLLPLLACLLYTAMASRTLKARLPQRSAFCRDNECFYTLQESDARLATINFYFTLHGYTKNEEIQILGARFRPCRRWSNLFNIFGKAQVFTLPVQEIRRKVRSISDVAQYIFALDINLPSTENNVFANENEYWDMKHLQWCLFHVVEDWCLSFLEKNVAMISSFDLSQKAVLFNKPTISQGLYYMDFLFWYPSKRESRYLEIDRLISIVAPKNIAHVLTPLPRSFKSSTCAICLETVATNETGAIRTTCDHLFHESCILQWYSKSHNVSCPICRKSQIYTSRRSSEKLAFSFQP